jgi:hypothetical protein
VKGVPNKSTAAVKDALMAVYADLQAKALEDGGEGENAHLMSWAKDNPTDFYKLWAKMLPTDVKAEVAVATAEESAVFKALPKATREKIRATLQQAIKARKADGGDD